MVTGASTADVAVVLLDAARASSSRPAGTRTSPRCSGIPHLVFAVNKMDLVDFEGGASARSTRSSRADGPARRRRRAPIPISALRGDNVVGARDASRGTTGRTLLEQLETVEIAADRNVQNRRFAVQWVIRPMSDEHHDYRGYAGQVASGTGRPATPSSCSRRGCRRGSRRSRGRGPWRGPARKSVTIRLEGNLDISRGDLLADPDDPPVTARQLVATVCWMSERPLRPAPGWRSSRRPAARAQSSRRSARCSTSRRSSDESRPSCSAERHRRVRLGSPSRSQSTPTPPTAGPAPSS